MTPACSSTPSTWCFLMATPKARRHLAGVLETSSPLPFRYRSRELIAAGRGVECAQRPGGPAPDRHLSTTHWFGAKSSTRCLRSRAAASLLPHTSTCLHLRRADGHMTAQRGARWQRPGHGATGHHVRFQLPFECPKTFRIKTRRARRQQKSRKRRRKPAPNSVALGRRIAWPMDVRFAALSRDAISGVGSFAISRLAQGRRRVWHHVRDHHSKPEG
jgi:hypothetical protein